MTAAQEKRVNLLLVKAGYKETEVAKLSKCVRAGLIRGKFGFKFTGDPKQLDTVVLEGECKDFSYGDCTGVLKATVRDLLKQQDYAGTDYEENSSEAPVKCGLCKQGQYVTRCCSSSKKFNPVWDSGKAHNHCTECPGLGKCIGDYRETHCHGCGGHYFGGFISSFPCQKCSRRRGYDDDDDDEGQPRKRKRMNSF